MPAGATGSASVESRDRRSTGRASGPPAIMSHQELHQQRCSDPREAQQNGTCFRCDFPFFVLFVNFVAPFPTAAKGRATFIVQHSAFSVQRFLSLTQMQQPSQNGGSTVRTGPSVTCFTKTPYDTVCVR